MVKPTQWSWKIFVLLAVLVIGMAQYRSPRVASEPMEANKRAPVSTALAPIVGTASCSGRGCHGGIEPGAEPDKCLQNEYLQWSRDPHADAYRVLFNDRSKQIAKLLGGPLPAHEDARCLACHTNPLTAELPADDMLAQAERHFGVGCESCHGSANQWLAPHTSKTWRTRSEQEKWDSFKMVPVTNLARRAETCAGCHVGAPPDKDKGLPVRDVNHDLIAAGHPRLNFEFGTFQANMPSHWRTKKNTENYLWAIGQVATAQAALDLLTHRAKSGPWPEFAEYDCFACHHSLAEPSWRQQAGYRGRKPGALPWGSWSFALTRQLAPSLDGPLNDLEKTMQQPYPSKTQAIAQAMKTHAELTKLAESLANNKDDAAARKLIRAVVANDRLAAHPNWDSAEQIYLALHALNQSQSDPEVHKILHELTPIRAFRPGFDSPMSLPHDSERAFQPKDFLEKLKAFR